MLTIGKWSKFKIWRKDTRKRRINVAVSWENGYYLSKYRSGSNSTGDICNFIDVIHPLSIFYLGDYPNFIAMIFFNSERRRNISLADLVKEAAIKSKFCLTANLMSSWFFLFTKGSETSMPRKLIPLFGESIPPLMTAQIICFESRSLTFNSIEPSSVQIQLSFLTSCRKFEK